MKHKLLYRGDDIVCREYCCWKNISRNIRIVANLLNFLIFMFFFIYLSVQSTASPTATKPTAMQTQYTVFFPDLAIPSAHSWKPGSVHFVVNNFGHCCRSSDASDSVFNTLQFLPNECFFISQFLSTSVSYFFQITHKHLQCRMFSKFYNFLCQLIFVAYFGKLQIKSGDQQYAPAVLPSVMPSPNNTEHWVVPERLWTF